jgi:hypothetical protein
MFRSFFLAGFECATGINRHGLWFDQIAATQHDLQADDDYRRLDQLGIHAVREGVRWPLIDRRGRYDFSSVEPFVAAARRHGLEVIWDLFHYGYPPDLEPFSPLFSERFAAYCGAAARFLCAACEGPWYFTPMNEPSYFSWAAGQVGHFAPHLHGRGSALKVALIRAAIRGIDAIRGVCREARIVNVDPICRVVPPHHRTDLAAGARDFNERAVFEAWDMLCGRSMPELGGSREHLGIVGVNYYATNQWEIGREEIPLAADDPRRVPLRRLVEQVWLRYGGELLITETGQADHLRPGWIADIAAEGGALLAGGIPLRGICLYPILGMPDWHERARWVRMGLWDLVAEGAALRRRIHQPTLRALQAASIDARLLARA